MAKRYKLILSLLFIVLLAAAVVVVTGVLDINKRAERRTQSTTDPAASSDYTDLFQTVTDVALPVLKTRLEGVYYTIDQNGDVHFYERNDGNLKELPETGAFDVKAECGSEELPAKIPYLETDGETAREDPLSGKGRRDLGLRAVLQHALPGGKRLQLRLF